MLVSLSNAFYNKDNKKNPSALAHSFIASEVTDQQFIEHVTSGKAFTPATFTGNHRKAENFIQACLIGLDFDNGVSVHDLAQHALNSLIWLIYATPSSTVEHPRSRMIIKLDNPITDKTEYENLYARLMLLFNIFEPDKTKSAGQLFYGSDTDDFKLLGNVVLITELENVLPRVEPVRPMEHKSTGAIYRGKELLRPRINVPSSIELRNLLSKIPPDDIDYDEWLSVLMAIHWCYPNSKGIQIAKQWTDHSCYRGEIESKWKSFSEDKKDGFTVATIYHYAEKFTGLGVR